MSWIPAGTINTGDVDGEIAMVVKAKMACYRAWNRSPKVLSCAALRRLRDDARTGAWKKTDLCPTCTAREKLGVP